MNYLLDKKNKNKKFQRIAILAVILVFVFYFRVGILKGLSTTIHFVSRPFVLVGNGIGNRFHSIGEYFSSKKMIVLENETLKLKLGESEAKMANHNAILEENLKLKEILDRKKIKNDFTLSAILIKPNRSLYDTLIIDIGSDDGISLGKKVFAKGDIPIGYVGEVYAKSSKVILYSSPGEKTDVVVDSSDVFMQLVGRGGGNFEMILPRDFTIKENTEAILPGIMPLVIAKVATIISDPRDSYQKALFVSPVNIFELKFVEVEK